MNTHNTPVSIYNRKKPLNYPKSAAKEFFSDGLKNDFETAVENEPSMLETVLFI